MTTGGLAEAMGLGERVPLDEADEMREPVVVAVTGRGGRERRTRYRKPHRFR